MTRLALKHGAVNLSQVSRLCRARGIKEAARKPSPMTSINTPLPGRKAAAHAIVEKLSTPRREVRPERESHLLWLDGSNDVRNDGYHQSR